MYLIVREETNMEEKKKILMGKIWASKHRSAWGWGVKLYAYDLIEGMEDQQLEKLIKDRPLLSYSQFRNELKKILLNGAADWKQYSWGGCSLIYNCQIARRLCTPSELRKTNTGKIRPNKKEEWLDVQARALSQAFELVHENIITL